MLLKFAYDGTKFYGYQRQKDLPTVEGEILRVLRDGGIATKIKSASRTDRDVSALGNVIWIPTHQEPRRVIGILNSRLNYIYFYAYALQDINPRHADLRWYRYHLLNFDYDMDLLRESINIFQGKHDFRNFTRARKNTVVEIKRIEINENGNMIFIDFYARNFLWNMIRRIVAAMLSYAQGDTFGEEIFEKRKNFGLAPPEPLLLMDIIYPFDFVNMPVKMKLRERFVRNHFASMVYLYLACKGKL